VADQKISTITRLSVPALTDIHYVVKNGDTTRFYDDNERTGGLFYHGPPQLRLTSVTGVPVPLTDQTVASIFATPSSPQGHPLAAAFLRTWDGTRMRLQKITADKSLAVSIIQGTVQDVFIKDSDLSLVAEYWKHATVTLTIASPCVVSWTAHGLSNGDGVVLHSSGALPTGLTQGIQYFLRNKTANDFELGLYVDSSSSINTTGSQSGVHEAYVTSVKQGNTTQPRTNALATPTGSDLVCSGSDNTYLWLGTMRCRANADDGIEDTAGGTASQVGGVRHLWNAYNQVWRPIVVIETADNWSYGTATARLANGATVFSNCVQFVTGLATTLVQARLASTAYLISNTAGASVGIGVDTVLAYAGNTGAQAQVIQGGFNAGGSGSYQDPSATYAGAPGLGAHFLSWLECGTDGTSVFIGDNAGSAFLQSGLLAQVLG
jgi:hypothetical protein